MKIGLVVLLILLILILVFVKLVLNGFKNKERKHQQTPAEFDIAFEEVRIPTKHGRRLYGWWICEDKQAPTIVVVHGWGRNVNNALPYIAGLYGHGYNFLAFDSRNHGHSDKEKHSTLVKFAEDLSYSIDFLETREVNLAAGVGVIGISIGGAASIYASAHDSRISAVATVGAFADPVEIMTNQMKERKTPGFLVKWIFKYMESVIGFRFSDVAPQKHIGKSKARFFLVHGKQDQTIPFSELAKLKDNAVASRVETLELDDKGHSDCHLEEGFWDRLLAFFNQTFKAEKPNPKT